MILNVKSSYFDLIENIKYFFKLSKINKLVINKWQ